MPQHIYQIESTTSADGQIAAEVTLNAQHPLFQGHFPGAPVTPGVIQLQIVRDVLSQQLGRKVRMKAMRTCKFLEVLNPAADPAMTVIVKYSGSETVDISASGHRGDVVFFKMQATYVS